MWETAFGAADQPITQAFLHRAILPAWGKGFEKISAAIAVRLALLARSKPRSLFLLVPEASDSTARYVAAGLLVGDFAHKERGNALGVAEGGTLINGDLLLITQAVAPSKTALEELKLGTGFPLGDLWEVAPLTRYMTTGYTKPRVYIANPGWAKYDLAKRPFGAVVIDATHPRTMSQLREILAGPISKVPIRIAVLPAVDKAFLRECGDLSNAAIWLWDPQAKADADAIVGDKATETRVVTRTVWVCGEDEQGVAALAGVHTRLSDVLQKSSGESIPGLKQACGIYYRLRQLTVPLAQLEQLNEQAWGGNLRRRVESLATVDGHGNPLWDAVWPTLKAEIERAYAAFLQREEPAKFWVLASRVEAWLREPTKPLYRIVVPGLQEVILLGRLLDEFVDGVKEARAGGLLEIAHASEEERLLAGCQFAYTLLPGPRSARTRYLDIYPPFDVEELAYPFEARMEQSVQAALYQYADTLADDTGRCALLRPMGLKAVTSAPRRERSEAPRVQCVEGQGRKVRLVVPAQASGEIDLDELAESAEHTLAATAQRTPMVRDLPAGAGMYEVEYSSGERDWYAEADLVDVFFAATDQIQRKLVRELQPGWQVICYIDDRYESLFDRLTAAVDERLPQRDRLALALWHQAKESLLSRHNGDRNALVLELKRRGLDSHCDTALSWFRSGGEGPLAPQQLEEFLAVAGATGCYPNEALMRRTFQCIQQHRGRHRLAGKALRALLRAILTGEGYEAALEGARKFDAAVGDVLVAVEAREVRQIRFVDHLLLEREAV
jgi:hypothetical protein